MKTTLARVTDQESLDTYIQEISELKEVLDLNTLLSSICEQFFNEYDFESDDWHSRAMIEIIRSLPALHLTQEPNPALLKLIMGVGAPSLYTAILEEHILPVIREDEDKADDFWVNFFTQSEEMKEMWDSNARMVYPGIDFPIQFHDIQNGEGDIIISAETLSVFLNLSDDYNRMVGRRVILKDVERRMSED